jgi:type IV fimbrial biogenesis protein FimT
MRSVGGPPYAPGFTLIELMVTIAIAAILMTVAAPSFVSFRRSSELTAVTNTLIASISAGRTESMKRGRPVLVRALGTDWTGGWRVFVDMDFDNAYSSGDVLVEERSEPLASFLQSSADGPAGSGSPYLRFDASGYSRDTAGGFVGNTIQFQRNDLSGAAQLAQTRRIKISNSGRLRVCTPTSSTDTTCSSSASDL